jgi:hypothetical protein
MPMRRCRSHRPRVGNFNSKYRSAAFRREGSISVPAASLPPTPMGEFNFLPVEEDAVESFQPGWH